MSSVVLMLARFPALAVLLLVCVGLLAALLAAPREPVVPGEVARFEAARPPAVAIVGGSQALAGVAPLALLSGLSSLPGEASVSSGDEVEGFAFEGADALQQAAFVQTTLLSGYRVPAVLVWAVDPLAFDAGGPAIDVGRMRGVSPRSLARAGAPVELLLSVALRQALPPLWAPAGASHRLDDLLDLASSRLEPWQAALPGLRPRAGRAQARVWTDAGDGWRPFEITADWRAEFYVRQASRLEARIEGYRFAPYKEAFVREVVLQARGAGSAVVLVELPVAPWYRSRVEGLPEFERWSAAIEVLARETGAVWVADGAAIDRDDRFGDPTHMPLATASSYSRRLGARLLENPEVRMAARERLP
jgi:hypothetical protein